MHQYINSSVHICPLLDRLRMGTDSAFPGFALKKQKASRVCSLVLIGRLRTAYLHRHYSQNSTMYMYMDAQEVQYTSPHHRVTGTANRKEKRCTVQRAIHSPRLYMDMDMDNTHLDMSHPPTPHLHRLFQDALLKNHPSAEQRNLAHGLVLLVP